MIDTLTKNAEIALSTFAATNYASFADIEIDAFQPNHKRAVKCPICNNKVTQDMNATRVIFRFAATPASARTAHDSCLTK